MDYVILWFDGDPQSSSNAVLHCDVFPTVEREGVRLSEPEPGYADALRAFIPEVVVETVEQTGIGIGVEFASGRLVLHPASQEIVGAEIAMLSGFADGRWMVWRPGEDSFEDLA